VAVCDRRLQTIDAIISTGGFAMPLSVVCEKCKEPVVFAGTGIELVGESRIGYRHRCGAMNELHYVSTDANGHASYRVVGLVNERTSFAA
jgi:hypothetical protein